MRMRLCDITLADFIELACGNNNVLLEDGETTDNAVLEHVKGTIMAEYGFIANRVEAKAKLMDKESVLKRDSTLLILKICNALLLMERYDDVRELLKEIDEYAGEDDSKLKAKVDRLIRLAEFEKKRAADIASSKGAEEKATADDIRSSFYAEIAFIMTYYKMNIDTKQVNAEVYANLVHQADIEIKARKAKK